MDLCDIHFRSCVKMDPHPYCSVIQDLKFILGLSKRQGNSKILGGLFHLVPFIEKVQPNQIFAISCQNSIVLNVDENEFKVRSQNKNPEVITLLGCHQVLEDGFDFSDEGQ